MTLTSTLVCHNTFNLMFSESQQMFVKFRFLSAICSVLFKRILSSSSWTFLCSKKYFINIKYQWVTDIKWFQKTPHVLLYETFLFFDFSLFSPLLDLELNSLRDDRDNLGSSLEHNSSEEWSIKSSPGSQSTSWSTVHWEK